MTNLQIIRNISKDLGLCFERSNSKLNGAWLYDFVEESTGYIVSRNWTISSAIQELEHGDLRSKIS